MVSAPGSMRTSASSAREPPYVWLFGADDETRVRENAGSVHHDLAANPWQGWMDLRQRSAIARAAHHARLGAYAGPRHGGRGGLGDECVAIEDRRGFLPVPKHIRGAKEAGATVTVAFTFVDD
jgi:hypothetical protein